MKYLKLFEAFSDKYEEYFTDLLDYGFVLRDSPNISFEKVIYDYGSLSFNSASIRVTEHSVDYAGDEYYDDLLEMLVISFKRLISIEGFEVASAILQGGFRNDRRYVVIINIYLNGR